MHAVQKTIVGAQFLFVAFGATVLVPLLVGLDPSVALFTAGKIPVFLGSSFAFIAPVIKATELYGLPGALFGIIGYIASIFFGEVDFQAVLKAQCFVLPAFVRPEVCYCVSYPYNRNRKITLLI